MRIRHAWVSCVRAMALLQGFHGDILPWLPGWCFHATDIHIQPAKTLRAQDHTPALSNALRQARDLQAPHATVHVNKWEWNNALHTNVTTVLPALSHLKFALYIDACVTSAMLEPLTKVPHCNVLSAFHLDLSSVRHAEASWPWEELWVRDVDMTQMLHLPKPEQASGARRVMRFNYMSFAGVGEVSGKPACTHACGYARMSLLTCMHRIRHCEKIACRVHMSSTASCAVARVQQACIYECAHTRMSLPPPTIQAIHPCIQACPHELA